MAIGRFVGRRGLVSSSSNDKTETVESSVVKLPTVSKVRVNCITDNTKHFERNLDLRAIVSTRNCIVGMERCQHFIFFFSFFVTLSRKNLTVVVERGGVGIKSVDRRDRKRKMKARSFVWYARR